MLQEERRQEILKIINSQGKVTITELCALFDVSEMTARRDLRDMDQEGLLRRVHGGAVQGIGRSYEPPFPLRSVENLELKGAIARKAAELVHDGDSIALDTGTTSLELVRALTEHYNLTIITSSLVIANEVISRFSLNRDVRLILTGGIVRSEEHSMVGEVAESTYKKFRVDKAFIGIGGVSLENGLTEYNYEDALVKKVMMDSAQQKIVLADSSKMNRTTFAWVAPVDEIDLLVTDKNVHQELVDELIKLGVEVLIAE